MIAQFLQEPKLAFRRYMLIVRDLTRFSRNPKQAPKRVESRRRHC